MSWENQYIFGIPGWIHVPLLLSSLYYNLQMDLFQIFYTLLTTCSLNTRTSRGLGRFQSANLMESEMGVFWAGTFCYLSRNLLRMDRRVRRGGGERPAGSRPQTQTPFSHLAPVLAIRAPKNVIRGAREIFPRGLT